MVAAGEGDGAGVVAARAFGSDPSSLPAIVDCVEAVDDDVSVVEAEAALELEFDVDVPDDPQPPAISALRRSTDAIVAARRQGPGSERLEMKSCNGPESEDDALPRPNPEIRSTEKQSYLPAGKPCVNPTTLIPAEARVPARPPDERLRVQPS